MASGYRIEAQNASMERLGLPLGPGATKTVLAPTLAALLAERFVIIGGCVVLQPFADTARRTGIAACHDETGLEAFVNSIHVEDWLDGPLSPGTVRDQTAAYVEALAAALHEVYPGTAFAIPIASSDPNSWTVRFHTLRAGQEWLTRNLDEYRHEAVMLVTTLDDEHTAASRGVYPTVASAMDGLSDDRCAAVADVARMTQEDGLSLIEAIEKSGFRSAKAEVTRERLAEYLAAHLDVAERWVWLSQDKRTRGGWAIVQDSNGWRVFEPFATNPGPETRCTTLADAAAAFIVAELHRAART